ncbi:MAG: SAM-dependent methyltransferase [Thermoplasmatales archaeon]|nr:SAM-dependent methyltransferase [Thermoplasmatales archaeon]
MRLIVENLEKYSEWVILEYRHCALIWENLLFTNVKDKNMESFLSEFAEVNHESVTEMNKKLIVLDPAAKKELITSDFSNVDGIVVGGILGYDKPKGRTKKHITDKSDKKTILPRNLGKKQMPIDIAAFVAKMIYLGEKIENIELTDQLEIKFDDEYSVVLPYAYPVIDNKVIVTPGLIGYLRGKD